MAVRPKRLGGRPAGERRREQEEERRRAYPWRAWYGTAIWRAIRRDQLSREPLCRRCGKRGRIEAATVVNHVEPHRGDWERFVGGPFESLCKACHDGEVQREERAAARRAMAEAGGGGRSKV